MYIALRETLADMKLIDPLSRKNLNTKTTSKCTILLFCIQLRTAFLEIIFYIITAPATVSLQLNALYVENPEDQDLVLKTWTLSFNQRHTIEYEKKSPDAILNKFEALNGPLGAKLVNITTKLRTNYILYFLTNFFLKIFF